VTIDDAAAVDAPSPATQPPPASSLAGEQAHAPPPDDGPQSSLAEAKEVAVALFKRLQRDNVSLLSAGVALFFLLALIPALIAGVSIYGLVADPSEVQEQVEDLTDGAPEEVQALLETQLERITESSSSSIGLGLVFGLAVALWAASAGVRNLIEAVNAVHDDAPPRTFLQVLPLTFAFTVGALVLFVAAVAVIGVLPNIASDAGVPSVFTGVVPYLLLAALFVVSLGVLYRFAPNRPGIAYRWISWGSACATVLWIAASLAFSFYVSNFGSYNETYGSLAAVVILILWLVITAYAIILGAVLNDELERRELVGL
jgi:membrane protein